MKGKQFLKGLLLAAVLPVLFTSCCKEDYCVDPCGDKTEPASANMSKSSIASPDANSITYKATTTVAPAVQTDVKGQ